MAIGRVVKAAYRLVHLLACACCDASVDDSYACVLKNPHRRDAFGASFALPELADYVSSYSFS